MNIDKDDVDDAVVKSANDTNKKFVISSMTPDGLFVMSTSNDGNVSPKSDSNPAASPPIISATKKTTSPRRSNRSRRSNSDIPNAFFDNIPKGMSPQQWAVPPPPHGMYHQHHPHDMMSSSWNGNYGLGPYHYSMMGNFQYNNETGPPVYLSHPLASGGPSTHSQVPLPYPVEDGQQTQQQQSIRSGTDQRHQNHLSPTPRVNDAGQPYNNPYPLLPHNSAVNTPMFQFAPPPQQASWQQSLYQVSLDPSMGQAATTHRPSSLKPPFAQRPPSVADKTSDGTSLRQNQGHRKSLSSSASIAGEYGSFWNEEKYRPAENLSASNQQLPFPPSLYNNNQSHSSSQHQSSSRRTNQSGGSLGRNQGIRFKLDNNFPITENLNNGKKFSPRNDLRKMFKELSPAQTQRKGNGHSAGTNTSQSLRSVVTTRGLDSSIHRSPKPYNATSLRLASPLRTSSRKLMSTPGGEATIIFKGVPSRESTRKKHQRQLSVQQYMEQIKGVDQPLQCRNVSFLLLFVLHLLFVGVYLGERYAKESLSPSIVPVVNPEVIRIDYHNLIFVSTLSGGFAIILSTVLLALMTMFARNYLQISLFITIGMAFIWGTLGVGLSPKTVVPVTGIIALGFAVAYTFIVWDRIPFHSTNLLSALSGIRVFPTTVVLATFMQILSLAWIVYFSVVAAGFYNTVQEKKSALSINAIGICYFLFGLSFFWTYQVIHVSTTGPVFIL
jgi:hypothetical protein